MSAELKRLLEGEAQKDCSRYKIRFDRTHYKGQECVKKLSKILKPYCRKILTEIYLNQVNKLPGRNIKYPHTYHIEIDGHVYKSIEQLAFSWLHELNLVEIDPASGFVPACAHTTEKGYKLAEKLIEEERNLISQNYFLFLTSNIL